MWLITLGVIFFVLWFAAVFFFHIAGWIVYALLILAVISILVRIIRGEPKK